MITLQEYPWNYTRSKRILSGELKWDGVEKERQWHEAITNGYERYGDYWAALKEFGYDEQRNGMDEVGGYAHIFGRFTFWLDWGWTDKKLDWGWTDKKMSEWKALLKLSFDRDAIQDGLTFPDEYGNCGRVELEEFRWIDDIKKLPLYEGQLVIAFRERLDALSRLWTKGVSQ